MDVDRAVDIRVRLRLRLREIPKHPPPLAKESRALTLEAPGRSERAVERISAAGPGLEATGKRVDGREHAGRGHSVRAEERRP